MDLLFTCIIALVMFAAKLFMVGFAIIILYPILLRMYKGEKITPKQIVEEYKEGDE